jgi:tetratricopeptide (TPR) repeat protein/MFS family permease
MKQYTKINNLVGWTVFLIAAFVYCSTIEPTASFWDCPEFITTGYKLEVGHPPGAPIFMLVANLFTQLTSNPAHVAKMVNTMSALMSAFCILFLFWSITHLVRKLVLKENQEPTNAQLITIMGSGIVGALVYTFSDTFWFSAVEGEVYAFSSLFTAVVFWLILKWEDVADHPHSDKWLVFIAYLIGLSIGVHLLNLLCIPAIVLVYYYKKKPDANLKGSILALIGSIFLIAIVLYGIVPGVIKVGGTFELFFVNTLGMSFNTGVIIYIITVAAVLIWGIYESYQGTHAKRMNFLFLLTVALLGIPFYGHGGASLLIGIIVLFILAIYLFGNFDKKYKISTRTLNTSLLCIMMMLIGYSSYALIVIRSTSNPPMDQNSPEDIFTLGDYLSREQYGSRPLFYGPAYSSKIELKEENGYCTPVTETQETKYIRKEKKDKNEKDSYIEIPGRTDYKYAQNMLFPRMYSSDCAAAYKSWLNIKGYDVPYDQCGEMVTVNMPTQWDNLKFFLSYQLNFMYWRYFMWNFAGRQNDLQSSGEIDRGNWITGFKFIDNMLVGNQNLLPKELKENKGRNVFYCMPLILGLLGLFWQAYKGKKGIQQFWVVFFLFFMTGIAIVLYLNQTPGQPRERDYAYAGSFYAFAIWIGMGVAAIIEVLKDNIKKKELPIAIAVALICLFVPIQMAGQTWDDHDRSDRYVCRDFGQNYLMSTQESGNPIIYTNGDNDTFPLWYNQETEGFRTDVRTCNLSYLQTDWYIDQMKRPAYNSPSLPITWKRAEYVEGTNEYVPVRPEIKKQIDALYSETNNSEDKNLARKQFGENPYELKNILKYWVRSDNPNLQVIPTDSIVIKVDKDAVRRSGMMLPGDSIPDYMHISLKGKRALYKSELMMLEMLANCNWTRPIYIAITVGEENQLGMENHFIQEGLAKRFTPFDTQKLNMTVDTKRMYDNLMTKFKFGGINKPGIYIDENTMRMCYTHRNLFAKLAEELIRKGEKDKALKALDYCEKMIPAYNVPYNYYNGALSLADSYYKLGQVGHANKILRDIADNDLEYIKWYMSLSNSKLTAAYDDLTKHFALLNETLKVMKDNKSPIAQHYSDQFNALYNLCTGRLDVK